MKVMNVGNNNYSNSKQQNFGMNLNLGEKVIKLIGGEAKYTALKAEVLDWRTAKGRNITVMGGDILDGVLRFRASADSFAREGLSLMKVDIARSDIDQTFGDSSCSDFLSRLRFNLAMINESFDPDLSKYKLK